MIRVFQIVQIYENMDLGTNFCNSGDFLGKLNPTLHGLQLYLLYMGGGKMVLNDSFWLKSTSIPKSK